MKPDYGLDAPGVVRNLFLVAALGLVLFVTTALHLWSGVWTLSLGSAHLIFPLGRMGIWFFAGFSITGVWMIWSSKVGKLRRREQLLDAMTWSGDERVLDVGCGRGLMLIGAARRLAAGGRAFGIDIWQAVDLSGNRAQATLDNATRERVRDRVRVTTADMRRMPFADASFDVVVSCAAIHNLYNSADRRQAIAEVARVLRPGGRALIDDIRHGTEYREAFERYGCEDVRRLDSRAAAFLTTVWTAGSLRPATLLARKTEPRAVHV